jgi:hypothetical protein
MAHGLIAKSGKRPIERARDAVDVSRQLPFYFDELFVFNVASFAFATSKDGFAEVNSSAPAEPLLSCFSRIGGNFVLPRCC